MHSKASSPLLFRKVLLWHLLRSLAMLSAWAKHWCSKSYWQCAVLIMVWSTRFDQSGSLCLGPGHCCLFQQRGRLVEQSVMLIRQPGREWRVGPRGAFWALGDIRENCKPMGTDDSALDCDHDMFCCDVHVALITSLVLWSSMSMAAPIIMISP